MCCRSHLGPVVLVVAASLPLVLGAHPQDPRAAETRRLDPSNDVATRSEPESSERTPAPAQDPGAPGRPARPAAGAIPVFRASSDLVVLHVNIADRRANTVPALPPSAFQVYEDGVPQAIALFQDATIPVATGLIIDNSSSMITRRPMVAAGVQAFAASSRDADEMFTIVFNEHVRFGLPPSVPFTRSRALLDASFQRFPSGGLTALHDAVIDGLGHIEASAHQKRALVVLSDGDDTASRQPESNMLYRASQGSAPIYTIWTGDLSASRGNPGLLRRLARRSGGTAYEPRSEQDVVDAFARIAATLRRAYSIGYTPTNTARDGAFRRVKVDVHVPGRQLQVHVREGYTAPDATP